MCLTVSVAPSINIPESSRDYTILIIPFISSLEMNKVNNFPALTASRPLFLKNLYNTGEVGLVANFNKTSLVKGIARYINVFFA